MHVSDTILCTPWQYSTVLIYGLITGIVNQIFGPKNVIQVRYKPLKLIEMPTKSILSTFNIEINAHS